LAHAHIDEEIALWSTHVAGRSYPARR